MQGRDALSLSTPLLYRPRPRASSYYPPKKISINRANVNKCSLCPRYRWSDFLSGDALFPIWKQGSGFDFIETLRQAVSIGGPHGRLPD
jgi:hypothetical protein